ncbi:MAG: RNA polymerase sigma factor [Tenuifilaceae bacterium]|jgi:RNA polymerase sigma-70 factor (ECF subfamily)|nr:RNA polymerase sigma factor [Tenuifilaceae bacterium]
MDERQFKETVIPISSKLYSICLRILGNTHEAKDCLQDIYLKLWSGRESLVEVKSLEAYAVTITKNQCLDRLRTRKRTVDVDQIATKADTITEYSDQEFSDPRLQKLNRVLLLLPEVQQRIFTLRDIERLEFDEIAKKMQMSQENVRVTLSRARKRIREIVEQDINSKKLVYE